MSVSNILEILEQYQYYFYLTIRHIFCLYHGKEIGSERVLAKMNCQLAQGSEGTVRHSSIVALWYRSLKHATDLFKLYLIPHKFIQESLMVIKCQ